MRYPDTHKAQTRRRIVAMAALRFRAEGLSSVGIANLMADLGLTHGGFYAHFAGKDELVAAACAEALRQMADQWRSRLERSEDGGCLAALAEHYLSPAHRDFPDSGCAAAALAGEISRQDAGVRRSFAAGLEPLLALLDEARLRDGSGPSPEASLAMMVGALLLARAVPDAGLSQRFLDEARAALRAQGE
ncbi:TetR/AcrR family transcriptional regulator [Chromobacterium violaceum]|uniref:TetR family transcriptional regulator n=1 Tax=Chromobacterium violaceum TaxID=536 RepID=A0A202B474_CHRVL|nr:TetR/AcrR family transcriptional regulator [Chromobacterium violaceum]MBA8737051.1 TetR/AcrR family transcriptional regulator [Chromobacterium violaceum]OVE46373.1 TetR family transcriptional regulator [Chromobacterium violaceum]